MGPPEIGRPTVFLFFNTLSRFEVRNRLWVVEKLSPLQRDKAPASMRPDESVKFQSGPRLAFHRILS